MEQKGIIPLSRFSGKHGMKSRLWRTDSISYSWKSSYLTNRPDNISNCENLKQSSSRAGFLRKTLKLVWDEDEDRLT